MPVALVRTANHVRFWLNGVEASNISIGDRGLSLGDGHFTTIKIHNGQLELWPLHQQRLTLANVRLGFLPIDWSLLQQELAPIVRDVQLGCLRITLTRGCSGRGYQPLWNAEPVRIYALSSFPDQYSTWLDGIDVDFAQSQLSYGGNLVGLKTIGRAEQVLIKQELSQHRVDDLLVCDPFGYVIEASAGNVFMVKDGIVITPQLSKSGIAGVMRQHLIPRIVELGYPLEVRSIQRQEFSLADQALACNCLMGVVPINRVAGRKLSSHSLATSLQADYDPLV